MIIGEGRDYLGGREEKIIGGWGKKIEGVAAGLWHTVCTSADGDVRAYAMRIGLCEVSTCFWCMDIGWE